MFSRPSRILVRACIVLLLAVVSMLATWLVLQPSKTVSAQETSTSTTTPTALYTCRSPFQPSQTYFGAIKEKKADKAGKEAVAVPDALVDALAGIFSKLQDLDPTLAQDVRNKKSLQFDDARAAVKYAFADPEGKIVTVSDIAVPAKIDKIDTAKLNAATPIKHKVGSKIDKLVLIGGLYSPAIASSLKVDDKTNLDNTFIITYIPDKDAYFGFDGSKTAGPLAQVFRRHLDGYSDQKQNGVSRISAGDVDAVISAREVCFPFGFDQICLRIPDANGKEDQFSSSNLKSTFDGLLESLKLGQKQDFSIDFEGALADVLGESQQKQCNSALKGYKLQPGELLNGCTPSPFAGPIVDSRVLHPEVKIQAFPGCGLIGVMSLQKDTGPINTVFNKSGEVYKLDGMTRIDSGLQAGSYLVFTTDPNIGVGKVVPIMFYGVNSAKETVGPFFLPGLHVEAFGDPQERYENAPSRHQTFVSDAGSICNRLP
jgi:hypothetical protein